MGEHYPRSMAGETLESWCNACEGWTPHLIVVHTEHASRLGHCLKCQEKREERARIERERKEQQEKERAEHERQNPRMF